MTYNVFGGMLSLTQSVSPWFQHFHDVETECDLQHAEHRSAQLFLNTADVAGVHAAPIVANRHAQTVPD